MLCQHLRINRPKGEKFQARVLKKQAYCNISTCAEKIHACRHCLDTGKQVNLHMLDDKQSRLTACNMLRRVQPAMRALVSV